ncbi:MAG: hypothetical protein AABX25_00530 [Nanoarchaeota archaeon]
MNQTAIEHMHKDLEDLKQDVALIKHMLSEEGRLSDYAKKSLEEARKTPESEYIKHEDLKKRILK